MLAPDGKMRLTDVADTEQILRISSQNAKQIGNRNNGNKKPRPLKNRF